MDEDIVDVDASPPLGTATSPPPVGAGARGRRLTAPTTIVAALPIAIIVLVAALSGAPAAASASAFVVVPTPPPGYGGFTLPLRPPPRRPLMSTADPSKNEELDLSYAEYAPDIDAQGIDLSEFDLDKREEMALAEAASADKDEEEPWTDADRELYDQLYGDTDFELKGAGLDADKLSDLRDQADEVLYEMLGTEFFGKKPVDPDTGIEIMWDPIFGSANPIDELSVVTPAESHVVERHSRDESTLPPTFHDPDGPDAKLTDEVRNIRKDMKRIEVYRDPWLDLDVPRNAKRWHGKRGELDAYPEREWMNNRFTKPEAKTDFKKLDPWQARKTAVRMARAKNNEWLPDGLSQEKRAESTKKFRDYNLLVGSLQGGECDAGIVERIQPALRVLGSVVDLLSIQDGVFRFHYHGLMKHRRGMSTWAETMIRDCGVECTGVVFETGRRQLDPRDDVFREIYE